MLEKSKSRRYLAIYKNTSKKIILPLASESISAGFPSPAEEYMDTGIDLNEELIHNPISTFLLRVCGNSMNESGIKDKDLIVVDRSIEAKAGHIVIAIVDGNFTLKKLIKEKGIYFLKPSNSNYPNIDLRNHENIQIWGVAIYSIHSLN